MMNHEPTTAELDALLDGLLVDLQAKLERRKTRAERRAKAAKQTHDELAARLRRRAWKKAGGWPVGGSGWAVQR